MISPYVKDIMRKWAKIGPLLPKMWGHFYGFCRPSNAFYRVRYGGFRRGSFKYGKLPSMNNTPPIIPYGREPLTGDERAVGVFYKFRRFGILYFRINKSRKLLFRIKPISALPLKERKYPIYAQKHLHPENLGASKRFRGLGIRIFALTHFRLVGLTYTREVFISPKIAVIDVA